jgi:hypothetical protein
VHSDDPHGARPAQTALGAPSHATAVRAVRFVRKMRGGSQAHLLHCDDDYFYVVKFRNNPQGRRLLVNEWIASLYLRHLQICGPDVAMVSLSDDFLEANPDVHMHFGRGRLAVESGIHFGSRYVGDGRKVSVCDFLPDTSLKHVANWKEFAGVMAFDKWLGNVDARQAVFLSNSSLSERSSSNSDPARRGRYVAYMIDHGQVFGGALWRFADSPLQGLYFRPDVYRSVRSLDDFQPWLDRILHFPEAVCQQALKNLPEVWLQQDAHALDTLLAKLMSRRNRVPELICEARRGRIDVFPQWRGG